MGVFLKLLVFGGILIQNFVHCQNLESTKTESQLHFKDVRVDTDLISFYLGTYLDFSYNETVEFPGDLISSPGCPKSHEDRPWVYYGSPAKCYLVGFHGPCPLGKRLFSVPNSKYGVCNCECFAKEVVTSDTPLSSHQSPFAPGGIIDYSNNDIISQIIDPRRRRVRSHQQYNIRGANRSRMINTPSFTFFEKPPTHVRRRCNSTFAFTTTVKPTPEVTDEIEIADYAIPQKSTQIITVPVTESKDRYSFCYSNWYKRQVVYDGLRQECTPFLDQGPCQNGEWLVRDLDRENGVTCEKRKCPEIIRIDGKPESGGSYSYFDYRRQACYTEVFGTLEEAFFANAGSIIPQSRYRYCRDAGMKYSPRLKTCVKDVSRQFTYKVIG